MHVPEEQK
jgi:hypothetical protein